MKMEINKTLHLSEHFTLGEVTKSRHEEIYNIPSHVAIENLKRVCEWLEELRERYNRNYVLVQTTPTPPRSALPLGSAKNLGGEIITLSPVFDEMVIKVIRNAH